MSNIRPQAILHSMVGDQLIADRRFDCQNDSRLLLSYEKTPVTLIFHSRKHSIVITYQWLSV